MKKTRNIYWTPKFHKHPSKARLIIAALQCFVEPLPKAVASVLKLRILQLQNTLLCSG